MTHVSVSREDFSKDRQGRTFSDVLNDPEQPFGEILAFFNDSDRQQRMVDSEIHHDRAPMAGVVRELESQPNVHRFLSEVHAQRSQRLRQAIGVLVRIIMERKGWKKTGKKGSLGVRAEPSKTAPAHNTGGLSLWFLRAERYETEGDMPFPSVSARRRKLSAASGNATKSRLASSR